MKRWCLAILIIAGAAHAAEDAAIEVARGLYESGRYQEAKIGFEKLSAANRGTAETLFYLGKIAVHQCNYPSAISLLARAVALVPGRSDYYLWLGNAEAWAASTAAVSEKPAFGRNCLAAYRKALELDPASVPAHVSLMNFYRHVPAWFGGGLEKARAEADAIRRLDAARGAYATAVLCIDEKKYAQAYANLAAILRNNPLDYAANCALGGLALASGEHLAEGETGFHRCLELCPGENDESHEFVNASLQRLVAARAAPGRRVAVLDRGDEPRAVSP